MIFRELASTAFEKKLESLLLQSLITLLGEELLYFGSCSHRGPAQPVGGDGHGNMQCLLQEQAKLKASVHYKSTRCTVEVSPVLFLDCL